MRYNKCIKCGSSAEVLRVMPSGSLHQFCAQCGIDLTSYAASKGQATKRRNAHARQEKARRIRIVTRQRATKYAVAMTVFAVLLVGAFIR
jgi:hypothetical protein